MRHTMTRGIRSLAAGLAVLLAAATLTFGAAQPAHAADDPDRRGIPEVIDIRVGQDASSAVLVPDWYADVQIDSSEGIRGLGWAQYGSGWVLWNRALDPGVVTWHLTVTWPGETVERQYTVKIRATSAAPSWVSASVPTGQSWSPYQTQLEATQPAGFSLVAGALPAGLELTPDGLLHGTPTEDGFFEIEVRARNAWGSADRAFQIDLTAGTPAIPVWETSWLNAGTVTFPYSFDLVAHHTQSFAVVAGALPPGIDLVGGRLTGRPTVAGSYPFTVQATGFGGDTQTRAFTLLVQAAPPTWVTSRIDPAQVGEPFEFQLEATGAVTYAAQGALPEGLTLDPDGRLHGIPLAAGSTTIIFSATNSDSVTTARNYSIVVNPAAPVWTTTTLPGMRVADTIDLPLVASDAASFRVTAGALPAGLTISGDRVVGSPTAVGPYDVTIEAVGPAGATTSQRFTGSVDLAIPVWVTEQLGPFAIGSPVDVTIEATHATGFLPHGSVQIPPGLALNPTTGRLFGTPTTTGTFSLSLEPTNGPVTGEIRAFTLEVVDRAVWTGETELLLTTGQSVTLDAASSLSEGQFVSVTTGANPPLAAELTGDGIVITGARAGTGTVTMEYGNGAGTWSQQVEVEVRDAPVWTTTSAGELRQGVAVDTDLVASGAVDYVITDGALPAGLTLAADGSLTGTPTAYGPYAFTVTAFNGASGASASVSREFTGIVSAPLPVWTTESIAPFGATSSVVSWVNATNATTYSVVAGVLPEGVTFSGGLFSGTPTTPGEYPVTLRARNATGDAVDREFVIEVRPVATWIGPLSVLASVGEEISINEWIGGGRPSLASWSGSAVTFRWVDGELLMSAFAPGTASVTVLYTNGAAFWSQELSVEVRNAPVWRSEELGAMRAGEPFDGLVEATDATGFEILAGALPDGLELAADGSISGTPLHAGPYWVEIGATNGDATVGREFTGEVLAPHVEWVTESFPVLDRNVPADLPVEAADAVAIEVVEGELPPGLELEGGELLPPLPPVLLRGAESRGLFAAPLAAPRDWAITGTPTEAGTYAFTLAARNASDEVVERDFELVVAEPELTLALGAEPGDEASGAPIGLSGSGLEPGAEWRVTLHSEPVEVAAGQVAEDGTFAVSAALPQSVPFGAHELRLTSTGADGAAVQTSLWFSVGETARIVEMSTTGPVAVPTRTPAPSPAPAPAAPAAQEAARIADTGTDASGWLGAAAALLLAGVAAVGFARRRSTAR